MEVWSACLLTEKFRILIQFTLKFIFQGLTDNKSSLVQVVPWHHDGYEPLPDLMMAMINDAIWHH